MQSVTRRLALVLFLASLGSPLLAASKAESIDALVRRYNELRQFNGTVLVADASGVIHKKGYGYANFEWQIPNTPDVRFRLGSITKQFTQHPPRRRGEAAAEVARRGAAVRQG